MTKYMLSKNGFTLIELLIVFSIMTILASIGVASYVTYSHSAQVDTNMKEYKSSLYVARSRALSQIRDSKCFTVGFTGQGYQLQGYQVVACCSFSSLCLQMKCNDASNNYELQAVYSLPDGSGVTSQTCVGKKFTDPHVSIEQSNKTSATYFFFSAITGAVTTNAGTSIPQLGISGYGITKLATVSATGVIQ